MNDRTPAKLGAEPQAKLHVEPQAKPQAPPQARPRAGAQAPAKASAQAKAQAMGKIVMAPVNISGQPITLVRELRRRGIGGERAVGHFGCPWARWRGSRRAALGTRPEMQFGAAPVAVTKGRTWH